MKTHPTTRCCALLGSLLFLATAPAVFAQTAATTNGQTAERPAADPDDVASVDAIITAVYDVISGPAGQKRDWDRFRSLLTPTCQFIPIQPQQDGTHAHVVLTGEQFLQNAGPYFEQNGFYEKETARRTERYGNLVHAFSTYASFRTAEDKEPFQRGINSFQLLFEKDRWWIANIAWQPEWQGLPIPDKYLSEMQ